MKKLLIIFLCLVTTVSAQEMPTALEAIKALDFKTILKEELKFSTIYGAINGGTSKSDIKQFSVVNGLETSTIETPYDYSITLGIRKIARFGYENKAQTFYDGTESKITSQTSQMENSLFGEYYNLSSQNGWYIDSISTDQSGFNYTSDSPFELKGKEGRWYNYIRGNSLNFDLSNFNFQGIGEKKTI